MKPGNDFYGLEEIAARWTELFGESVTVDDLLKWRAKGKLTLIEIDWLTYLETGGVSRAEIAASWARATKSAGLTTKAGAYDVRLAIADEERARFEGEHSHQAEIHEKRCIVKMTELKNKDDWFYVLREAILAFESEHRFTPNTAELWHRLKTKPPAGWHIQPGKHGDLTLADDAPMDREAMNKRYARLYRNRNN